MGRERSRHPDGDAAERERERLGQQACRLWSRAPSTGRPFSSSR